MTVQYTNDLYCIGAFSIKNDMLAHAEFAVTVPDVATVLPFERISDQLVKTGIQQCQVLVALVTSLMILGVATDLFHIGLRLVR